MKKWTLFIHVIQFLWCIWLNSIALVWYLNDRSILNLGGLIISSLLLVYFLWCIYRALYPKKIKPKELDYVLIQKEDGQWWVGLKEGIATYGPFDERRDAYEFIIDDIKKEMKNA